LIKACRPKAGDPSHLDAIGGVIMSSVDIVYLAVVLVAFVGFATALAYYSHR
jgi:uncharacterized protein YciW